MIQMMKKPVSIFLAVLMVFSCFSVMGMTAYAENTEALLTTITATGKEQASYSVENVATVSFSYTTDGSSAYLNNGKTNWGWWGYGWIATVTPTEGYTITKCVFFDDKDRTATDSEAPFVVETTEEDKTPKVNGTPILANQSKGITKIEVYGYAVPSTYTVTWQNEDGTVLETDTDVAEGTVPTYDGETPTKAEDEKYIYSFSGWSPEVAAVTGDVTYTAQFDKQINSDWLNIYSVIDKGETIRFTIKKSGIYYRGLVLKVYLDHELVKDVNEPNHSTSEPDRYYTATQKCTVSLVAKTIDAPSEYTLYLESLNTVTWQNDDGTVLETDTDVAAGTTPTYDGETPIKADDAQYTYTFAGWTPAVTAVSGDVTYTATYTATERDVLPTVTAVDSTAEGYDTAYEYTYANDGSAKYANYYGDITVSFDRAIEADDVVLAGAYDNYNGGAWNVVPLRALAAGEEFRIVKEGLVGQAVTFAKLLAITGGDFRCAAKGTDVSGVTMTVKFNLYETKTSTEPIEIASSIKTYTFPEVDASNGSSLTLTDGVKFNAYIDADAYGVDANEAAVKLTYNHNADIGKTKAFSTDTIALTDATKYVKAGDPYDGTYKFAFATAPAQYAENITIELYATADAETPLFTTTTSVKSMGENVIALAETDSAYTDYANLCKAFADYCQAAQVFFSYDAPAAPAYYNDDVTTLAAADMEVPSAFVGIEAAGFSFTIVSALEVNVFYNGNLDIQNVSIDSTKGADTVNAETTTKSGRNCINITGIASGNLDNVITVNTSEGVIELSAINIAKAIAGSADTNYANLARALYLYSVQASAFFGA